MKILCIRCNDYMGLIKKDYSGEESVNIIFNCSKCNNQIAMITNTHETQMIRTLGLNIGGAHIPQELSKSASLTKPEYSEEGEVIWTKEAEDRFKRIPSFVQPVARTSIIGYAKEKGIKEITARVMDQVKERAGM